jgi:hypothetical protein
MAGLCPAIRTVLGLISPADARSGPGLTQGYFNILLAKP